MVKPDVWIPRLTNGKEGLLEQASDFPKHVNPNDVEDLDDMFMYENQIHGWSQAPSSSVVIEELSDSPKRKALPGKGIDDEDGESNDEDYDPAKNDDDVAVYGIDDDYLFDWLTEAEGNDKGPEASIFPAIGEGSECDEDDEAMFGAVDSDEEAIGEEEYDSDGTEAITERTIQKGWEPHYKKSDKSRVRVFCKAMDREFELFASQKEDSNTFQIKTYKGNHNCARVQENCVVKVPYLVRKFFDMIKIDESKCCYRLDQDVA
ncbi:hypothetical protein ACLB2K_002406 [Fragaria x ananassa]